MKRIVLIIVCCLFSAASFAQEKTIEEMVDSIQAPKYQFTLYFDVVGLVQKLVSDYGQYEGGLRYNIKDKYFPALELGLGKADHNDDVTGIHYDTSAPFFKLGCDFNIANQKHADHKIMLGARYGFTSYKVNISSMNLLDPVWKTPFDYVVDGEKANMHWAELLFSLDTRIVGPLRLGWSVRYRHRLKSNEGSIGKVWYVPGYGKYAESLITAMFTVGVQLSPELWKRKTVKQN